MRAALVAAFLCLAASPVLATGSLTCSIKSPELNLEFEGVVSHGLGEQLTDARGSLAVTHPLIMSDLKSNTLERQDVTQFWMSGRDLRLRIYRDSATIPGESIEIVIETQGKSGDDGMSYSGRFKADIAKLKEGETEPKTTVTKGKASCTSD